MDKPTKKERKSKIVSFRTSDEAKQRIDREAKKRKQTRADFVAATFFATFNAITGTTPQP
jgi:predicted DNA-binding protein